MWIIKIYQFFLPKSWCCLFHILRVLLFMTLSGRIMNYREHFYIRKQSWKHDAGRGAGVWENIENIYVVFDVFRVKPILLLDWYYTLSTSLPAIIYFSKNCSCSFRSRCAILKTTSQIERICQLMYKYIIYYK